jgi:hypothetical protein
MTENLADHVDVDLAGSQQLSRDGVSKAMRATAFDPQIVS